MRTASPLRYPGGKAALSDLISRIRSVNRLGGIDVAEPFAGGAGASLSLLFREDTREIYINDVDQAIHDFWWTLVNRPKPFISLLNATRVSMAEWRRQRDVYRSNGRVSRLRRGFSAFYLNRCNRSGIIMNGGPIGGIAQAGRWKLGARYNKTALRNRCAKVSEYGDRIHVSHDDGLQFIAEHARSNTFLLIDPPYYVKGPSLYLNKLDHRYHVNLSEQLRDLSDAAWVLTYDDCPAIRKMYSSWAKIRPFSLRYAASERRGGREILITPRWMHLPTYQASKAIEWGT